MQGPSTFHHLQPFPEALQPSVHKSTSLPLCCCNASIHVLLFSSPVLLALPAPYLPSPSLLCQAFCRSGGHWSKNHLFPTSCFPTFISHLLHKRKKQNLANKCWKVVLETACRHFLVTSMLNNQLHATLASGQSVLQPALTASQAGKTSRDFELVLMKTIKAKYYQKPPVAWQGTPKGEESPGRSLWWFSSLLAIREHFPLRFFFHCYQK